jgi:putative membrane protein insertion efficiency factor
VSPSVRNSAGAVKSAGSVGTAAARAVIYLIQLYRHMVSPLRPASCRFIPTCSQYAVDALTEYGVLRGCLLAVARLAKCGPWHKGGWDPIPERHECRVHVDVLPEVARDQSAEQGKSESFV